MPIPKTKTKPQMDLASKTIICHGAPKCGKSTLFGKFPDAIFLATEPGLNSLEVMRWEDANGKYVIDSWEQLKQATGEIVESGRFKTIVIDTIDLAYELCRDYVCRKYKEEYHTDGKLSYGKGTTLINNEMRRYLLKLASVGIGIALISHSVCEEIETRTKKHTRMTPNLPEKVRKVILGTMNIILYCDFEVAQNENGVQTYQRVLRTKSNPTYEAGDRTNRLPGTLPLEYNALAAAFKESKEPKNKGVIDHAIRQ